MPSVFSYTVSRARDNLLTGNVGSGFSDNNDPEKDYGPSNLSAPHIFVANGSVIIPGDINVAGIVSWRSGAAFNPRGITDQDGDGLVDQRDVSVSRNDFRTDPFFNVDLRVEKVFPIGNAHSFSVLVEAFNLTNHEQCPKRQRRFRAGLRRPCRLFPRSRDPVRDPFLLR